MSKLLKNRVVYIIAAVLVFGETAWANDINARALELAAEQRFDSALETLSKADAEIKSGYEHRFLKARILSWAGEYDAARRELDGLMREFPDNPDLQLAMGNLEYYQGNLDAAEIQYKTVLNRFPNYQDARQGLENVRKARADAKNNPNYKWRLDGGLGFTDLSQDGAEDWNTQFFRAEYTAGALAYHGSVQRYDRFGETNIQMQAGLSDAVRGGWDWGLEVGFTPDALFRPDFSAGGRLGRAIELPSGAVVYPNISYRYDDYAAGGIHTVQPGLLAYLDDGLVLTGRLIGTFQDAEDDQIGWLVQSRKPVMNNLEFNFGYADAPEAIDGVAISTKSVFGGLTYAFRKDLDLHLNLARDDREGDSVRKSVNVGFTHRR